MKQGKILLAAAIGVMAFALVAWATSSRAQAPAAPDVQALQQRVLNEVSANLQCNTSIIALQRELDGAKAELAKSNAAKPDTNGNPQEKK